VLVSGCSAGGLAVLLGIDKIRSDITSKTKNVMSVKGMVDSGVFADYSYGAADFESTKEYHDAVSPTGALDYSLSMRNVFKFMNLTAGIDSDCLSNLKAQGREDYCIFAENVGLHVTTPFFLIQVRSHF